MLDISLGRSLERGVAAEPDDMVHLVDGGVKKIYRHVLASGLFDPDHIYYTPLHFYNVSELLKEVKTGEEIEKALNTTEESHIQTMLEVVDEEECLIRAPYAKHGDLEKYMSKQTLSLMATLSLASDVVDGVKHFHAAGFVTGDPKPDNVLIFETPEGPLARLSDLGKARKLAEGETAFNDGNTRFLAYERVSSHTGEVFSSGLMILRLLEEHIDKEGCEQHTVIKDKKERRGIEGLLLTHGRSDKKGVFGFLKNAACSLSDFKPTEQDLKEEKVIHNRIDEVLDKFINTHECKMQKKGAEEMRQLLKEMTSVDPQKRPSMIQVANRFEGARGMMSKPRYDNNGNRLVQ